MNAAPSSSSPFKAVRTDAELECPTLDAGLRARGVQLVTLPDGVPEEVLAAEVRTPTCC